MLLASDSFSDMNLAWFSKDLWVLEGLGSLKLLSNHRIQLQS